MGATSSGSPICSSIGTCSDMRVFATGAMALEVTP